MAAIQLRFLSISSGRSATRGPRGHAAEGPKLMAGMPSGSVREIPLSRRELVRIIKQAADALERLDREEGK